MGISRVNGGAPNVRVQNQPTTRTTTSAKQQTQGTGYTSSSSYAGSSSATPEQVQTARDTFARYVDFSSTANGGPDTNSDPDHVTLATMASCFGKVASDTRDRLCNEAKAQMDSFLNQQPPPSQDQIDAKMKEVKDTLRQKMELESSMAKLMQDTQNKIKELTEEVYGSKWQ
jgi:hypothetical protein